MELSSERIDKESALGENNNEFEIPSKKKRLRNKTNKTWNDVDEVLINAVMKKPCLWDHTISVKLRSPLIVKEAWLEVAKELNDKFEVDDIKKRWRNLKDSYKKARKKATAYIPSGSATIVSDNKDSFRFYDQMKFLNDSMNSRPTKSNISQDSCDSFNFNEASNSDVLSTADVQSIDMESIGETSGILSSSFDHNQFTEHTKRTRKQSVDAEFKQSIVQILSECNKRDDDDIEGFLMQLAAIMKKLSLRNRRILQRDIMNLAYEAEEKTGIL